MQGFPVELLYVLAIIGFVLFNILGQRAARRRQQEQAAQAPAAPPPVVEVAPLEEIWGRIPPPAPVPAPLPQPLAAPTPPAPPARRRRLHPARALLKDPRDLRRAVVLMMVLGPCRAEEPPPEQP